MHVDSIDVLCLVAARLAGAGEVVVYHDVCHSAFSHTGVSQQCQSDMFSEPRGFLFDIPLVTDLVLANMFLRNDFNSVCASLLSLYPLHSLFQYLLRSSDASDCP